MLNYIQIAILSSPDLILVKALVVGVNLILIICILYTSRLLELTRFKDGMSALCTTRALVRKLRVKNKGMAIKECMYHEFYSEGMYMNMIKGFSEYSPTQWRAIVFQNMTLEQRIDIGSLKSYLTSKGVCFETYYTDKGAYVWLLGPGFKYKKKGDNNREHIQDQIMEEMYFVQYLGLGEDIWLKQL